MVGSRIDPAEAFGMLCPACSTSLLSPPDTDSPRQELSAEIMAVNTVKLNDKCLGVVFLSHCGVSTVSCSAGLKIHPGGMGSILH